MAQESDTPFDRSGPNGRQGEVSPAPELDRLPPPAFPPGTRRSVAGPAAQPSPEADTGFPDGALIAPDEPIRRIADRFPQDALISPDDPIAPRHAVREKGSDQDSGEDGDDPYEVEVTGIGEGFGGVYRPPPEIRDAGRVAEMLEEIARSLREEGAGDLVVTPATSKIESTLRALIAGYLLEDG